jgi:hypothetical protein
MAPYEYFHEAVICEIVCKGYERLGLIANAHYFKQRAIYMIAKGLEALALQAPAF